MSFNMLRANDLIWSLCADDYLFGKEAIPSICSIGMPTQRACQQRSAASSARHVPREPSRCSRWHHTRGFRSTCADRAPSFSRPRGSRAPWRTTRRRHSGRLASEVRARRIRPHRVIEPPGSKIRALGKRRARRRSRSNGFERNRRRRLVVAGLDRWVASRSEGTTTARKLEAASFQPIEDAPGLYVRVRAAGMTLSLPCSAPVEALQLAFSPLTPSAGTLII